MSETSLSPSAGANYAAVNNLRMYYEIHGAGQPLVVLHGGAGGIEMLGSNLEALAKNRKVIAVDYQAHGHTQVIDPFAPISGRITL